jgi:Zn-dependent metalloprotease
MHVLPARRGLAACALALAFGAAGALAQDRDPFAARQVAPRSLAQLRDWDRRIDGMLRAGELRVRATRPDVLVPGRTHQRADQFHKGVRVVGGDVSRQLQQGLTISVFGSVYPDIQLDTAPGIDEGRAREIVAARAGVALGPRRRAELVVLPHDGRFTLAWQLRAASGSDVRRYFVDARTGAIVLEYSDRKTQAQVGRARGVLGDVKKISVSPGGGQFVTRDELRPPSILTYDLRGDYRRIVDVLNGVAALGDGDLASDADNDWTDGAAVDAHVYAGWTYDYLFKRFNRRGLDNADLPILSFVHPVRRTDIFSDVAGQFPEFFLNAGYYGDGVMIYGVGLPAGSTLAGQAWDFLSGGLDVVTHELAHGVTEYTSDLIYRNESGALNEAFSDILATGAEFFFQQPGANLMQADYLLGEDIVRPGGLRSLANPGAFGDPDHYSRRFTGTADNGGVHINSAIANHAFYLAIEGGTNRTSGLPVQGVGANNREQIERVFYRAFTDLLPANATFALARAATIQSARDLYGANSAAERAVTQAWTAVGVN